MRRALLGLVLALAAGVVGAVEVRLNDGTVISAESYKLTGSYLMLKLADGRQVAYDVGDVDLDALRATEAAAAAGEQGSAEAEASPDKALSSGRQLKDADAVGEDAGEGMTISDRDVKHVRGSGVLGEGEEEEAEETGGVPAGYQSGGGVVLNDLRVSPAGEGRWQVSGEIVNRSPNPVLNVRVILETIPTGTEEKWTGEVPVASSLGPDEKGAFSQGFSAEKPSDQTRPNVRANVVWMQQETQKVPDYKRGAPHPSNLPLDRGGVGGADLRPTPID